MTDLYLVPFTYMRICVFYFFGRWQESSGQQLWRSLAGPTLTFQPSAFITHAKTLARLQTFSPFRGESQASCTPSRSLGKYFPLLPTHSDVSAFPWDSWNPSTHPPGLTLCHSPLTVVPIKPTGAAWNLAKYVQLRNVESHSLTAKMTDAENSEQEKHMDPKY